MEKEKITYSLSLARVGNYMVDSYGEQKNIDEITNGTLHVAFVIKAAIPELGGCVEVFVPTTTTPNPDVITYGEGVPALNEKTIYVTKQSIAVFNTFDEYKTSLEQRVKKLRAILEKDGIVEAKAEELVKDYELGRTVVKEESGPLSQNLAITIEMMKEVSGAPHITGKSIENDRTDGTTEGLAPLARDFARALLHDAFSKDGKVIPVLESKISECEKLGEVRSINKINDYISRLVGNEIEAGIEVNEAADKLVEEREKDDNPDSLEEVKVRFGESPDVAYLIETEAKEDDTEHKKKEGEKNEKDDKTENDEISDKPDDLDNDKKDD